MKELICLSCKEVIVLHDDPVIGQTVLCPDCNGYFVVTHVSPVVLDWVMFDDDDYYDHEDDFEDAFDEDYSAETKLSEV